MIKERKYAILIGDGMADLPIDSLGGKTPLEYAKTPNMDFIASNGMTGMAKTVPGGMSPGSDTANLSIFGYDPVTAYTGRAPLEALNMGLTLGPDDAAFRCNFVLIEDGLMKDFSAGHIQTEFSRIIISELREKIAIKGIEFYPGVSYRNIMIWRDYPHANISTSTPPHDIHEKPVSVHLPSGDGSRLLNDVMKRSVDVISGSKRIRDARSMMKGSPSSAWLWGGGKRPSIETLNSRFGLRGHTISAVDLINGIGRAAGLTPIEVAGATGYLDTNYEGKADALLQALDGSNYVFLHVESPDESGHEGSLEHKIQAIEDFDRRTVGRVLDGIKKFDDYTVLLMPDHPTPVSIRTHTSDPVPFSIYSNSPLFAEGTYRAGAFTEKSAAETGLYIEHAHELIEIMIHGLKK